MSKENGVSKINNIANVSKSNFSKSQSEGISIGAGRIYGKRYLSKFLLINHDCLLLGHTKTDRLPFQGGSFNRGLDFKKG